MAEERRLGKVSHMTWDNQRGRKGRGKGLAKVSLTFASKLSCRP